MKYIFLFAIMFFIQKGGAQKMSGTRYNGTEVSKFEYEVKYTRGSRLDERIIVYFESNIVSVLAFNLDNDNKNLKVKIIEYYDNNAYPELDHNIHFTSIDSLKFVNNLKINDTNIVLHGRPGLLFSANAKDSLSVKLYKYKSVHDNVYYEFNKIENDETALIEHIRWIKEYYKSKRENIQKTRRDSTIRARKTKNFFTFIDHQTENLKSEQENKLNTFREQNQDPYINEETVVKGMIRDEIVKGLTFQLKVNGYQQNSSVTGVLDFVVDTIGKIQDDNHFRIKFKDQNNSTNIEALIGFNIVNSLKRKTYPKYTRIVSGETMYESLVLDCEKFCRDSGLRLDDFATLLQSKEEGLRIYKSVEIPVFIHYEFELPIKLEDSSYKWIYDNKKQLKSKKTDSLIIEQRKLQFLKIEPNPKPGLYYVKIAKGDLDYNEFLDTVYWVNIHHRYFTMYGVSYTSLIGTSQVSSETLFKGYSHGIDLFYIHHHFGVFAGTIISDTTLISNGNSNQSGKYLTSNESYFEGGIYLAAFNYLYLKAGIASIVNNPVGPILGVSLILPWIQIEYGYNYVLKSPYMDFGINIKVNK